MILVAIYVAVGIIFYYVQERIIFHPTPLAANYNYRFTDPHAEINIPAGEYNLHFVKFLTAGPKKGIVLYFHGNMDNLERYAPTASLFTKNDYEVWMIDYPGFGKTTGEISEKRLYSDARKMYEQAAGESDHLLIYGRSVGTGVASQLASEQPCDHLLLETPYYSMAKLAKDYAPLYPVRLLLKYELLVNAFLKKVNCPITIFHGTEDELIPFSHAEKLKKEKPSLTLVTIKGGRHNDLSGNSEFIQSLQKILTTPIP